MSPLTLINVVLLWVVTLFALLLTLGLVRKQNTKNPPSLKVGQQAPNFTAETLSGEVVTLSTYAGRSVAFLFTGPSCSICREALPLYEDLGPKAARSGVEIVLVSVEDRDQSAAFVKEFEITLPVLIAPREQNPFMENYKIPGTPSYCLVGPKGKVQSAGYPDAKRGEWKALADSWRALDTINSTATLLRSERR